MDSFKINIKGLTTYTVRLVPDSHHGGYRARLWAPGGTIMEPHGKDKISALKALINELRQGFESGFSPDNLIGEAIEEELDKALRAAGQPVPDRKRGDLKIPNADLERRFNQFVKLGGKYQMFSEVLLGSSAYVRKFKMPKWNVEVDALQEPKVAIRYWNELGFPPSKHAHSLKVEGINRLEGEMDRARGILREQALERYGRQGPEVSGAVREHFPTSVKDRLRFLAHGENLLGDARRLHATLMKTRSPVFK